VGDSNRERWAIRRPTVIAIAVVVSFSISLGAIPAFATTPGVNGRIAFRQYFNSAQTRGAIFTIRPDGTDLFQVTHRGKIAYDHQPVWSPDGRWIAFQRVESGKPARIFKIRPNGTHLALLSLDPSAGEDEAPGWSPSGKRIVFHRFNDSTDLDALFVMWADGTHVRQIPHTGSYKALGIPRWSPDAKRLMFSARTRMGWAVFTIRPDGSHRSRVTPWRLGAGSYDWSPDGKWLLIESHTDTGGQRNVFLVHPNGNDLHAVTSTYSGGQENWGGLAFSPDGTMIVAAHGPGAGGVNPDIWVMGLDGSGLRDVTNTMIYDSAPSWGPKRR
jgi:Tol biopolymer transport system component